MRAWIVAVGLAVVGAAAAPANSQQVGNFDVSNEAYQKSAEKYCKHEQVCSDLQCDAYGALKSEYETAKRRRRAAIEQGLSDNTHDGVTNWYQASLQLGSLTIVSPNYPSPSPVYCSTHISKNGRHAYTSCR